MDRVRLLLEHVQEQGFVRANFLGLLNVLIGRRISEKDGTPVSAGLTYRELAGYLKRVRWEPDAADELGIERAGLAPRDRERYWYQVILLAHVDSAKAMAAGEKLAGKLRTAGYDVGPAPGEAPT
jgi:hypothetical protein